jgi:hypothetical protein
MGSDAVQWDYLASRKDMMVRVQCVVDRLCWEERREISPIWYREIESCMYIFISII